MRYNKVGDGKGSRRGLPALALCFLIELLLFAGCLPWEFPWQTATIQQKSNNELVRSCFSYTDATVRFPSPNCSYSNTFS